MFLLGGILIELCLIIMGVCIPAGISETGDRTVPPGLAGNRDWDWGARKALLTETKHKIARMPQKNIKVTKKFRMT